MSRKRYERDVVLASAMDVFWAHGYEGSSMRALCEATGLNRKSLYAEFASKDDLFDAALEMYIIGGIAQSREALEVKPLGVANVRRYFEGMRYEPQCRGCLMTMTANERGIAPEGSVERVRDALRTLEKLLTKNLKAGGYSPSEAKRTATFLVFSIQGITTMGKLEGDNRRLRHAIDGILCTLNGGGGRPFRD